MKRKPPAKSQTLESRRVRLLEHAARVFENRAAAERWLREPQIGLGGAVPFDIARTARGAAEVSRLLTRVDYGVYA